MAQSLCKIYLHIIFHVKTNSPLIKDEHLNGVHRYIGGIVNSTGSQVIRIGGVNDHIHLLCLLSSKENVSHLVEEVKRNSSRWIKDLSNWYSMFAWQGGYAALSVSESVVPKTIEYIDNQRKHHEGMTFKDEYLRFLQLYNISYDERFVLSD